MSYTWCKKKQKIKKRCENIVIDKKKLIFLSKMFAKGLIYGSVYFIYDYVFWPAPAGV